MITTSLQSHAHSHMVLTTTSDKHAAWDGSHLLTASWLRRKHSPNITRAGRRRQSHTVLESNTRRTSPTDAAPPPSINKPLKPVDLSTLGSYLLPASGLVSEALLTRLVLSTYNVSLAYASNHSNVLPKPHANTLLTKHANGMLASWCC